MSEDAPQLPPEGVPQEQQPVASETQATAGELGGAAVEATQIPVQDGENATTDTGSTQWDEAKASTVGMATREAGYSRDVHDPFQNKHLEWARGRMSMMDSDAQITWGGDVQEKARNTEALRQRVEDYKERDEEVPEYTKRTLEHAEAELDQAKTKERKELEESLKDDTSEREEAIAKLERPFEELYDLAPETFANMPTSEFMEVTKQLITLKRKLNYENQGLHTAQHISEELRESFLERRRGLRWDSTGSIGGSSIYKGDVSAVIEEIQDALLMPGFKDNEEYDRITHEVDDKYRAVFEGSFDKTPRQIVEGVIELTDGYAQQIAGKVQEALRQKNEFLKKYGVKTESEESETAASPSESEN